MCGIAGIITREILDNRILEVMAESLRHRGPDSSGTWTDRTLGVGLAHRRLSILDLTESGNQPMVSESGRYVISYNGEVYNHAALHRELDAIEPRRWRGHSDTEVLVNSIEQWGVRASIEHVNGVFAFAVWDRLERTLTLARDRIGEKPLYIGWIDSNLVFASELKAFRSLPQWRQSINPQALGFLFRFGYIPAPLSIHTGIFKLPAASLIQFKIETATSPLGVHEFAAQIQTYWSLPQVAIHGIAQPLLNESESLETFQNLLEDAVRLRMLADVPVGVLLSGGIDSSLVAALMQRHSAKAVRTFTIGFGDEGFDEARYSEKIAHHIGSEHTEVRLSPERALEIIPRLPEVYDEPFADPSQIPTVLVSQIARQHVTVALSGDGGDELFFGYTRYFVADRLWRYIGSWPAKTRTHLAAVIHAASRLVKGAGDLSFRMRRLQQRVGATSFDDFYANLTSLSCTPVSLLHWPPSLFGFNGFPSIPNQLDTPATRMMFTDQSYYLPEDILTKVDRASMAVALEVRSPLLDHRLLEFCWRLPAKLRFDGNKGKVLMRQLLARHVPRGLWDRPKHGFDIPLDKWLRGPLRNWMLNLLNTEGLKKEGLLNHEVVSIIVDEHVSGQGDHGYALWPILMFQSWIHSRG